MDSSHEMISRCMQEKGVADRWISAFLRPPIRTFVLVRRQRGGDVLCAVKRPIPNGQSCIVAATRRLGILLCTGLIVPGWVSDVAAAQSPLPAPVNAALSQYCLDCHDGNSKKGELDLERISRDDIPQHSREWEHVVRKLRTRQMPP